MQKMFLALITVVLCVHASAEDCGEKWPKRLWKASIAAVAAGSVLDVTSSLGKNETNGLLANQQGVFSASGVALKLAISGAALGAQRYLVHRYPGPATYKTGALLNFSVAGALGGAAAHNYAVHTSH